jgi:long-chain acyl-CoA synthetase
MVVRSPEGADLDEETLIAWSQENLGRYKYPRRVEFVDSFPMGPSGKILKRELVAALR